MFPPFLQLERQLKDLIHTLLALQPTMIALTLINGYADLQHNILELQWCLFLDSKSAILKIVPKFHTWSNLYVNSWIVLPQPQYNKSQSCMV